LGNLLQLATAGIVALSLASGAPEAIAQSAKCKKVVTAADVDWVSTPELERCAADGDRESEALLGMMYWGASEDGGWPEDYGLDPTLSVEDMLAEGLRLLLSAASKGQAEAMNELGLAYLEANYGLGPDPVAARDWLEKATAQGDMIAPFNLARIHLGGMGVPSSEEKAEALLRLSANSDYRPAVCSLHVLMERRITYASWFHRAYYALMRGSNPNSRCGSYEIMPELLVTDQSISAD
jgi:TPR repeat protein